MLRGPRPGEGPVSGWGRGRRRPRGPLREQVGELQLEVRGGGALGGWPPAGLQDVVPGGERRQVSVGRVPVRGGHWGKTQGEGAGDLVGRGQRPRERGAGTQERGRQGRREEVMVKAALLFSSGTREGSSRGLSGLKKLEFK